MSAPDDESIASRTDREATEWLARLRGSGALDQQAFEDWYSADPAHADAYDRVLASWEAIDGLAGGATQARPRRRSWGYGAAAMAAVLVMAVGIGLGWPRIGNGDDRPVLLATKVGEVRTLALADGSRVTLDTQSAISADVAAGRRSVQLERGRARFAVAASDRPLVIETGVGSIALTGGILDVEDNDSTARIGLLRGTAIFRPRNRPAGVIRLSPGSSFEVDRNGPVGSIARFTTSDARWTAGMLAFEGAPLSTVVAAANRYDRVQIALADPGLGALRYTGTVKAGDTAGLARMLAAMFKLRCDERDPRRLVLSRSSD